MDNEECVHDLVVSQGKWKPSEQGQENQGILLVRMPPFLMGTVASREDLETWIQSREWPSAESIIGVLREEFIRSLDQKTVIPAVIYESHQTSVCSFEVHPDEKE